MSTLLRKVNMKKYLAMQERYELRSGTQVGAPLCPYGNHYQWIGFDIKAKDYVRFTKSVFVKLLSQIELGVEKNG